MNADSVIRMIASALTPYVGQTMAQSSIESQCRRLGIDMAKPDRSQVDRLLDQLTLGLNVFIGRDKSDMVMRELRATITKERS